MSGVLLANAAVFIEGKSCFVRCLLLQLFVIFIKFTDITKGFTNAALQTY